MSLAETTKKLLKKYGGTHVRTRKVRALVDPNDPGGPRGDPTDEPADIFAAKLSLTIKDRKSFGLVGAQGEEAKLLAEGNADLRRGDLVAFGGKNWRISHLSEVNPTGSNRLLWKGVIQL